MKTSAKSARGTFKKEKTICGLVVICAHAGTTGNAWDTNEGQSRSRGYHVFVPRLTNFRFLFTPVLCFVNSGFGLTHVFIHYIYLHTLLQLLC